MGYYDSIKLCRSEFKRFINEGNVAEAKKCCNVYARLLEKMAVEIGSYKDTAYLKSTAKKLYQLEDIIAAEGICDRVRAVDIDADEIVIPAPANKKSLSSAKKTEPAVNIPTTPKIPAKPPLPVHTHSDNDNNDKTGAPMANQPLPKPAEKTPEPIKNLHDDEEWSADIFEKFLPATVIITTYTGEGTGFLISEDGYVLTNHHVVFNGSTREGYIRIKTGDKKSYSNVEFIASDKKQDVALLKIDSANKFPFINIIKDYSEVRVGSNMMIIGNGLGFGLAPITGNIKFTCMDDTGYLVYTAPTNGGDSGSPVLNKNGVCIGIHKAREGSEKTRGVSFATPASEINKLLSKWKKQFDLDL